MTGTKTINAKRAFAHFFLFFTLITLMIGSAGIAIGSPLFGPPHQYYGEVTVNGNPALDGLLITAKSGDKVVGAGQTKDGRYGYDNIFVVSDADGTLSGKTIRFYIQGFDTGQTVVFSTDSTAVTNLDLSVSGVDFCGDGVCSSSESCSTCPDDCGPCPTTGGSSSSSSSSRSGGGGGLPPMPPGEQDESETADVTETIAEECTPDWVCSDWLDCISGAQKRVCVDGNRCGVDDDRPVEERECQIIESSQQESSGEIEFSFEGDSEGSDETRSLVTGAIVGDGNFNPLAWSLLFVLVASAVVAGFYAYSRRN